MKGEGEASRNTILNQAFAQDPEFFEFIRSMEAYSDTFKDGSTTMVISPDSDFFEYFENSDGNN
jgi:membrane protease subunit HflC